MLPDSYTFTAAELGSRIEIYFIGNEDDYQPGQKPRKGSKNEDPVPQNPPSREPGQVTFAGLAYFLGFESMEAFANYETQGEFAGLLKRARLRIEAVYEKKLQQSPAGVIFVLKNAGWNEKGKDKTAGDVFKNLTVEIVETGHLPVSQEKEVDLS